ncbi:zinc-binding oxidoreductase [Colletotrichum musicola]|uniref:Zinc-binding oxidoreductase n=1 Tax=Colletotrichum musicola TaxID=2175873 RepID=A0A8H6N8L6_9PEZI|nr:zinc-binding oxidoreductase [Colletotrichum musicola]
MNDNSDSGGRMKAIHILGPGKAAVTEQPVPKLRPGHLLVQPVCVAVQPSDWKHVDYMLVGDPTGVRMGFEYSGHVCDVGPEVTQDFRRGDRVFGLCHASNSLDKENGTFAEYAVVRSEFQMRIPENLSWSEAASLSCGLIPVCQGLYQDLGLPWPGVVSSYPKKGLILIYGGSTVSGMMGIQFAKLSKFEVITTCSAHNFGLMKYLGADHCVEYHSEGCDSQIRDIVRDRLTLAWDCISTAKSARTCATVMSKARASHYSSLLYINPSILRRVNQKITCTTTIGYTIFGERLQKETVVEPRPEDYEYWLKFWAMSETLLRDRQIRPPPQLLNVGGSGLCGVLCGMNYLKKGQVSGAKLVYDLRPS